MPPPPGYIRTSKRRPCPVCDRPDGCLISEDGAYAGCIRVETGCDRKDDGSPIMLSRSLPTWRFTIDRFAAEARRTVIPAPQPSRSDAPPIRVDWPAIVTRARAMLRPAQLASAANGLGISEGSLQRLELGYDPERRALTFPMRDDHDRIIGVRLRRQDGSKFAVSGSRNGLFVPRGLGGLDRCYIVEGPTDCGAMLDLGFDCIGRPSCSTCVDMTCDWFSRQDYKFAVIIEDHDAPKQRPDGSTFTPGQDGATRLIESLVRVLPTKIIAPIGCKDARDWKRCGVKARRIERLVECVPTWRRGCYQTSQQGVSNER